MYRITELKQDHYEEVKSIYEAGIATGNATFQSSAPAWAEWDKEHVAHSRLVALDEKGAVAGWAALTAVSGRCVYAGVAEVSVYVHPSHRGHGLGRTLLEALIQSSEQNNLWTLQAGIFPENAGSLRIHERCGFRKVGYREKIGKMNGLWRDTVLLERRSLNVGV